MAIPIVLYYDKENTAHSNMLIIKRLENGPIKIQVEHFEPYGNIIKDDITFEITHLKKQLDQMGKPLVGSIKMDQTKYKK